MTIKSLEELFLEMLKDIYYAEKKLVKILPKIAGKAFSPRLKEAIQSHLSETESHVERLEEVFTMVNTKPTSRKCEALDGLMKEADKILAEIEGERTIDAGIISTAQTVEHYEIARYGTLVSWARELGMDGAETLLQATLDEEKAVDEKLSGIAENYVNERAAA